jgi:hypothetical protein
MIDNFPNMENVLEGIRPPATPDEAYSKDASAFSGLSAWNKRAAIATIAGLMTDPNYQVNGVRMDWLLRLVISKADGRRKPKRRDFAAILNEAFEKTGVWRLEDPVEDFLCDVVPTIRGDFLIFTGHWEHAAAYTQTVIQAFEALPDALIKSDALNRAYALLSLSDALARRAPMERHAVRAIVPWQKISLPSDGRISVLSRKVRFSFKELASLGIAYELLAPFTLPEDLHEFVSDRLPGDTPLEFYPLIKTDVGIIVVHPGNLSLAARSVLLRAAQEGGVSGRFLSALSEKQQAYAEDSGFFPGGGMKLPPMSKELLRACVCQFAPGRYLHLIQVQTSLAAFPQHAFGSILRAPPEINARIKEDVERFWKFLGAQGDHRESITVLLMCGWGAGAAIEPDIKMGDEPKGWRFLPMSFADAAILGACKDGKLRDIWRMIEQMELLEREGYSYVNMNGMLNMFGFWRDTGGNFIPEHVVDAEPPLNLLIPTDALFKPSLEAAHNRDLRALPFPGGGHKIVQRVDWWHGSDLKPIYASIVDAKNGSLRGAVAIGKITWWVEATEDTPRPHQFDWQYQLWNAILEWLAEAAPSFNKVFASRLSGAPAVIRVVIAGEGFLASGDSSTRPEGSAGDYIDAAVDAENDLVALTIRPGWGDFLRYHHNCAEFALVVSAVEAVLRKEGHEVARKEIGEAVKAAIPSEDWRWLHASKVTDATERLACSNLVGKFHEIPHSSMALVKCGSVWRFHDRSKGSLITGEQECLEFLRSYREFILAELTDHIRAFNRQELVKSSAERYQAARRENRQWRISIRAVRTIRGEAGTQAALERQSAVNALQRAAKIICEIAACEAQENGGATPGREDLDEMYARALLLFGNGQIHALISAGMMDPELRISPAGDLLSDKSVYENSFVPVAAKAASKGMNEAARRYVDRSAEETAEEDPPAKLAWEDALRSAVEAEYGCTPEVFVDLQFALTQLAKERGAGVFFMKRSELADALHENEHYPKEDLTGLLARLTLERRDAWQTLPEGYFPRDLELWRFDRPHSLINRPLLALTNDADPLLMLAPIIVSDATMYAIGGLHQGTLHNEFWVSKEAKAYAGKRADEEGRAFEDKVVETLNNAGWSAKPRQSIPGLLEMQIQEDLGDIDVFVVDAAQDVVWVLEAKNLRLCRTEVEIAARMTEYHGAILRDSKGREKPDKLLRHIRRVRFLRDNVHRLTQRLRLSKTPIIRGLVVVDVPQPMNFHKLSDDPDSECCMLDEIDSVMRALRTT